MTFFYMHIPCFCSYSQGPPLVYYSIKMSCLVTVLQVFLSLEWLVPVFMDFYSWHCLSTDTEDRWLHEGWHVGHCVREKVPGTTFSPFFHCSLIKQKPCPFHSCSSPGAVLALVLSNCPVTVLPQPSSTHLCRSLLCSWNLLQRGLWLRND